MDAPLYPPAAAYHQPAIRPEPLNADTIALGRLLADPAAKPLVLKELPLVNMMLGIEALTPHLDNMSPRSFVELGAFKKEDVDRLDAKLRALPQGRGR